MKRHLWLPLLLVWALCLIWSGPSRAAAPVNVPTAWMGAQEAFPIWYAKQKGWDRELGLNVEMLYFSSGMDALKTLPAKAWVFGGMGGIPAMMGALRYGTYVIADCNDEALANAVMVRPDSPLLKTRGYNKTFPEVYGTPEDVRGKTVLCTTVSSAHFALSSWLKVLGLKESEVVIKNMDQPQALAAFEYGIGDMVTLWAPLTYVGELRGWKTVANPHAAGQALPIVIVADSEYADAHPDVTAKFLSIYLRAIAMIQQKPAAELIPEYLRFYREWAGTDYTPNLAEMDIKTHPLRNLEQQLQHYDTSRGSSPAQRRQTELARFFASTGSISPEELKKIEDSAYVTDKFLKRIQVPFPPYH